MPKLTVHPPAALDADNPPALEQFQWRFLCDGDSWFSIGTLNLLANSNLLFELSLSRSAIAINCGYPGETLRRIVNVVHDPHMENLLIGVTRRPWDALLISGGGNDVIELASVRPDEAADPSMRLLLLPAEWGPESQGPARYVSDTGWQRLAEYLRANLDDLIALRDHPDSESKGVPIFMHTYALPTPRDAGAGLGNGPWLWPAMQAYGIPADDRWGVAADMLGRLGRLFQEAAADAARFPNLHVFDTATKVLLVAADETHTGPSGDWVNEIHLTRGGYRKLGRAWGPEIEGHL